MLDKKFDATAAEASLYSLWESSGAFAADPSRNAKPFTIMIPPPNVTGRLHVGHALTMTSQDLLIRFQRMQGRDALWQPGTDHAGIATQLMVERALQAEGATRQSIGRNAFLDRVWRYKDEQGGEITRQLRRLGASPDWSRERFTMDEGLSRAVRAIFVRLHREGLIYRARRLVNWDPAFQSAISDLEVEMREVKGKLWHILYPIEGSDQMIAVATSRPETMLGDTAVAVNPEDMRYQHLIGKFIILPITGRRIPIIADEHSDPEKGSGAVKITPAHDFNDFAVGQRHGLPMLSILDKQARVTLAELDTALADPFLATLGGKDRFEAREAIVAYLEARGLLDHVEAISHQVPHADRSDMMIEPLLTEQWFCNAGELAKPAIAAVEEGRVAFVPKQWENTYFAWMRNIEPWCISRQLWWGHRIPAWYGPDGASFVADDEQGAMAQAEAHYGHAVALRQDEDVLDTWFSSALWPFSTLGWPEATPELARYYPGDVLVTGFDIIFFWVARMIMMGLYVMQDVPFRTVLINGLVRDERGQKMSKTKGNVIDPLSLIDAYGADALRFTVAVQSGAGRNIKLGPAMVETNRSFVTKLWNAARFCEMNSATPVDAVPEPRFNPADAKLPLSRWILDAAAHAIAEATAALEAYRLNDYAQGCYRFVWNDFCDWFLELAKPGFMTEDAAELRMVAAHVLDLILRLLHPVTPFVTEALWDQLGYGPAGSLIRAPWPELIDVADAEAARAELSWVIRLISEIRAIRAEMNVPAASQIPVFLHDASAATIDRAMRWRDAVKRLARVSEIGPLAQAVPKNAVQAVLDEATLVLPLSDLIDLAAERARLAATRVKTLGEAEKISRKLENTDFVGRAPEEVVAENRERLAAAQSEITRLDAALARLN